MCESGGGEGGGGGGGERNCCIHRTHTHTQTEKARHILQVHQKLLETQVPQRGVATWPSDDELSKLSDEHKAMLAQKCVNLLLRKSALEEAVVEVSVCVCVWCVRVCVCVCVSFTL